MNIKIDIDGVIRDIITPMCDIYNGIFNTNVKPEDINEYDIEKFFPYLKEKYKWRRNSDFFFKCVAEEVFLKRAKLIKGVCDAMTLLKRAGYNITLCSYQEGMNKIHTLKFLDAHLVVYDDIYFGKNKHLIKGDYLIDDNPDFLKQEPKHKRILINAPYNTHYNSVYLKADSLLDAVKKILEEKDGKDK